MPFSVIVKKLKTIEVSILIIRQERPEDYDAVYHVVKEAFENAEYTDGNEQNLVVALRKSKSFIPELSLVAVEDEKIVGHNNFRGSRFDQRGEEYEQLLYDQELQNVCIFRRESNRCTRRWFPGR